MILTEKRKRRFRNVVIVLAIICITPLCEKGRMLSGHGMTRSFAGEELTCAIDLGDDMYGAYGLKTGFSYELLERFAKDHKCDIKVIAASKGVDFTDSLKNGAIDILIKPWSDSTDMADAKKFDEHSAWMMSSDDLQKSRTLDIWMSHIKGSDEYEEMRDKYFRSYNPHKRAEKGIITARVSPYDNLIKKYSKALGWDWRMLAAVVYQESKFSINSVSHRGAKGLMQVMPQTARHYGIENLTDPEQNLIAGTSHLKRLQNLYAGSGMSQEDLVKFTLAAYNAGEGRIKDCRNFASSLGEDRNSWSTIVSLIPQMREDTILENESVKLGKFKGYETIAYVDSIMALYESICAIHPSI